MPGQRKRKKRAEAAARRQAAKLRDGEWEAVFTTYEHDELRAFLHRLVTEGGVTDPDMIRIDMPCGRLVHRTSYTVSVFRPADPGPSRTLAP
ncbi:hypothetical protein [Streptomyces sp. NPDC048603]|uniref:hypothetical protein n=1 Tax=Streptomyces sp. NPDC048603 TaxID=3365577 RepID=UPI003716CD72